MGKKWYEKGSLTLGKEVIVSDPCYEPGMRLAAEITAEISSMLPGEYTCFIQMSNEEEWGRRVSRLKITRDGYAGRQAFRVRIFQNIGVDSAQCGFFDKDYFVSVYKNRSEGSRDAWYEKVYHATYRDDLSMCWKMPAEKRPPEGCSHFTGGTVDGKCAVSSSGYGDGMYVCSAKEDEDGNVFELILRYI